MKDITNIAVTGEDGVVTYADGSSEEFQCSGNRCAPSLQVLQRHPEKERKCASPPATACAACTPATVI
ncbi:hypothetical protein O5541_08965 [Escherichia coli]|nr:hypothetical protein [Escherichia coli]